MSASIQVQIDTLASSIATAEGILADLRRTHRTMPPMGTELLEARERIAALEEQIGTLDAERARAEHEALEARTTVVELTHRLSDVTREAQASYARGCAEERAGIVQGIADALGPCGRDPRLDSYRAGLRDALEMIRIRGEQG